MTISFTLPPDIEQSLRQSVGDLDGAAKEAALIELYRQDEITQSELGRALGLSRLETESLLKKHNVTEDFPSNAEIDAALARLAAMPPK